MFFAMLLGVGYGYLMWVWILLSSTTILVVITSFSLWHKTEQLGNLSSYNLAGNAETATLRGVATVTDRLVGGNKRW